MGNIPEETIEQVLAATDIVDIIGGYIQLKRAGSSFKALCPFHNEKTPSFNINLARQSFHCFGCGEGGGAIGFVMKYENLPFPEAVKKLADKAGITITEAAFDPKAEKMRSLQTRLKEFHNGLAQFMHEQLRKNVEAQHARDYLQGRKFTKAMTEDWAIGWIPEQAQLVFHWAKSAGFTGKELVESGVAALRDEHNPKGGIYLRFRDRLMFPIHNDYGDIIAFSGRQLRNDPRTGKYINSPQTLLFNKSKVIFGLHKARRHIAKAGFALICEGQIDVIACSAHGVQNAIAGLGTAFTEHHANLLKRYTKHVVLCYDSDSAGIKAAQKAYEILIPVGLMVKAVSMPSGEDPDSYIQRYGADSFQELINQASDFFDWKMDYEALHRNLSDYQERTNLANELAQLADLIPDKVAKDGAILQIASRLSVGDSEIRNAVSTAERARKKQRQYPSQDDTDQAESPALAPTPLDRHISYLCFLALHSQLAQDYLISELESLFEPLKHTAGGHLLQHLLAKRPNPEKPSTIQTYLLTLNQPDKLALQSNFSEQLPENPEQAARDTVTMLLASHLQKRETSLRAQMRNPNLLAADMIEMMKEVQEIQLLLSNIDQRYIR